MFLLQRAVGQEQWLLKKHWNKLEGRRRQELAHMEKQEPSTSFPFAGGKKNDV